MGLQYLLEKEQLPILRCAQDDKRGDFFRSLLWRQSYAKTYCGS